MPPAHLENMFKNGKAIRRIDIEDQCQCYPNQIWRVGNWGVIVILRSRRGPDFPLSQRAFDRIFASLRAEKIDNAYVVLAERGSDRDEPPNFVASETLRNVKLNIDHVEPMEFQEELGPCWFLDRHFKIAKMRFQPIDDYDM